MYYVVAYHNVIVVNPHTLTDHVNILLVGSQRYSIRDELMIFYSSHLLPHAPTDHINILLVGSGDLRHVLTTLANASGHTSRPLHVSKLILTA